MYNCVGYESDPNKQLSMQEAGMGSNILFFQRQRFTYDCKFGNGRHILLDDTSTARQDTLVAVRKGLVFRGPTMIRKCL
jgi:hypothetical protein